MSTPETKPIHPTLRIPTLLLLLAALLTALGAVACGSEDPAPAATTGAAEPTAATSPETAPAEPAPPPPAEAATTAAEPAPATAPATAETEPPPAAERDELTERERELAAREARLARREAALDQRITRLEETLPKAEPKTEPEPMAEPVSDVAADEPIPADDRTAQADDEGWRLSQHRTDRAAREGVELEDGAPIDQPLHTLPEPEAPAAPEVWDTRLLPSGTRLTIELADQIASDTAQAGDQFHSTVAEDVLRGGDVVIPAGSTIVGRIVEAVPLRKRVGGQARLDLEFELLEIHGAPDPEGIPIQADFAIKGKSESARDAATIGGAAAGGAILGRVLDKNDKGKGTVLGALIGAAAGTVIASRSEGEEVVLPEGARIELVLTSPVEVPVRR